MQLFISASLTALGGVAAVLFSLSGGRAACVSASTLMCFDSSGTVGTSSQFACSSLTPESVGGKKKALFTDLLTFILFFRVVLCRL